MALKLLPSPPSRAAATRLWPPDADLVPLIRAFSVSCDARDHVRRLVEVVVRQVGTARWCSITVANQQTLVTVAASDGLARQVDHLQPATGQGPSLRNAFTDAGAVHSADLACDRRWPVFGAMAADCGAAAVLTYRIITQSRQVAALNIYAARPHVFTERDDHRARLLTRHLAIAVDPTGVGDDPAIEPAGDDVIGQAKKVLQARGDSSDRQAFFMLVEHAHRTGCTLVDSAQHLTATGHRVR